MGGSMGVGGRREDRAAVSTMRSRIALPVVVFCGLGRRADAGRRAVADADGEGVGARSRDCAMRGCRIISVLCDPTTGGVAASFAMLGDLEPCRAWRADRFRRPPRDRADHQSGCCPRTSRAPNFCSRTGCSTRSSRARRCARRSRACSRCSPGAGRVAATTSRFRADNVPARTRAARSLPVRVTARTSCNMKRAYAVRVVSTSRFTPPDEG